MIKKIRLVYAVLLDVEDNPGEEHDYIWVYVKGRKIEYTVDDETFDLKSGSKSASSFVEYWKLVKADCRWVLDKIKQKNEMNLDVF
jgi:hypothetical protein